MRNTIWLIVFLLTVEPSFCQDPNIIRSKCSDELNDINNKIVDLNNEYEKIKSDLRNGLYCSKCGKSKTELDKSYPGGFYAHLGDVKGEAKPATQEQMQTAQQDYMSKYNSLKEQYDSKQKSCNERYNNAVNEQNRQAQEKQQELQDQLKQQQEQQRQELERQQEENRQKILQESEKTKQDAIKMFNDNSNRIKGEISSINMPSNTISFQNNNSLNNTNGAKDRAVNVDDLGDAGLNNYVDGLSHEVEEFGEDQIIAESSLPESLKEGYERAQEFFTYLAGGKDALNGEITENTVHTVFSTTENPVIRTIQNYSGGVAVKNANSINELAERVGNGEVTEEDITSTVANMNPLHTSSTFVKEEKPWSMKDTVVVVGGGIVLSAIGAPLWLGIGAAAWYGFKR
jgi:hypothetical protein